MRPVKFILFLFCLFPFGAGAAESWSEALAEMPLGSNVRQLNRTNCVDIMLRAFQSNRVVKALVFMPGATDELYMFRQAKPELTNAFPSAPEPLLAKGQTAILPLPFGRGEGRGEGSVFSPQFSGARHVEMSAGSLLDALSALTNQTPIRATFRAPLLLLHTDEDPLEALIEVEQQTVADKLKRARFVAHGIFDDRDWDFVQPILSKTLKTDIRPWQHTYDSWHFYRHSFAEWGLTGWEALEAVALAGKTRVSVRGNTGFTLRRPWVIFRCDTRVRSTPKLDSFPR